MATIKIVGLADGSLSPADGKYVATYDASGPNSPGMLCRLELTDDERYALKGSIPELWKLWKSVDSRQPVRPDGKPNRPLTAFTVQVG